MSRRKVKDKERIPPFPGGDGKALREWLQNVVVDRELPREAGIDALPAESCEELAHVIAVASAIEQAHRECEQLYQYDDVALPALETLADILPGWIRAAQAVSGGDSSSQVCAMQTLQAAIDALLEFDLERPFLPRWRIYAGNLLVLFCHAVNAANPGQKPLGVANPTGPVGKFLEGVIPYISGGTETPSAENIMQQLRTGACLRWVLRRSAPLEPGEKYTLPDGTVIVGTEGKN